MSDEAEEVSGLSRSRSIAPRLVTGGSAALAAEEVLKAALEGLEDAGNKIKDLAVERAPLLTPDHFRRAGRTGGDQGGTPGELKASASVEMDDRTVAIMFDAPYASYQHEHRDWHHDVGQSKYLESAMSDLRKEAIQIIADKITEVTDGD